MASLRPLRRAAFVALLWGCGGKILEEATAQSIDARDEDRDGRADDDGHDDAGRVDTTGHDGSPGGQPDRDASAPDDASTPDDADAPSDAGAPFLSDAQSLVASDGGACARTFDGEKREGSIVLHGVGLAPDGFVAAGQFTTPINFGTGPKAASSSDGDLFVGKYDSACQPVWVETFTPATVVAGYHAAQSTAVVADSAGNVIVGAFTTDAMPVGPYTAPRGQNSLFKLDASGAPLWLVSFTSVPDAVDTLENIAVDANDDIVITGGFQDAAFFGDTLNPAGVVGAAKITHDGAAVWHSTFAPFSDALLYWSSHPRKDGRVALGAIQGNTAAKAFVASLDADGGTLWSRTLSPVASYFAPMATSVGADGSVVVGTGIKGTVDFGGGPVTTSQMLPVMVKFDVSGNVVFNEVFDVSSGPRCPSTDPQVIQVHVADSGDIYAAVVGCGGTIDLGGGPLSVSGQQVVLAHFDASGVVQSTQVVTVGGFIQSFAVAADSMVFGATGFYPGAFDVGLGSMPIAGSNPEIVARLPLLP